jgi:hypothetical protein
VAFDDALLRRMFIHNCRLILAEGGNSQDLRAKPLAKPNSSCEELGIRKPHALSALLNNKFKIAGPEITHVHPTSTKVGGCVQMRDSLLMAMSVGVSAYLELTSFRLGFSQLHPASLHHLLS